MKRYPNGSILTSGHAITVGEQYQYIEEMPFEGNRLNITEVIILKDETGSEYIRFKMEVKEVIVGKSFKVGDYINFVTSRKFGKFGTRRIYDKGMFDVYSFPFSESNWP